MKPSIFFFSYCLLCSSASVWAAAKEPSSLETIEITGSALASGLSEDLQSQLGQQQVSFAAGGGISGLPVLNGMMGDKIQVLTDGMAITAACGNQMNPPLAFLENSTVSQLTVQPSVSPVAAGGDNIAGVIAIETEQPSFTDTSGITFQQGKLAAQYASINHAQTVAAQASAASKHWYLNYSGSIEKADSYDNGNNERVDDTLYKVERHAVTAGYQHDSRQLTAKFSHQRVPYQGFPGQYMDMVDNRINSIALNYQQDAQPLLFKGHLSVVDVSHTMGFFTSEKPGTMPMLTSSKDIAAKLSWQYSFAADQHLTLGQEYYSNKLNDYWPAVPGSMMMGPDNYININDGRRERFAAYAQWDYEPDNQWQYSAGVRAEHVKTNTGEVQSYQTMAPDMPAMASDHSAMNTDVMAANMFNGADRSQQDTLIDITLLAEKQLDDNQSVHAGVARKNRAPNLYERYTWGQGMMASSMIGWFADGNGYVGDVDLQPETAHNLAAGYAYETHHYRLEVEGFYNRIDDYIDVEKVGEFSRTDSASGQRNLLQFANLDATIKGVTATASWHFASASSGQWHLTNAFTWQDGKRDDTDQSLYQIMPVTNNLQLTHKYDNWRSQIQWQWYGSKTEVDPRRLENTTDSFSLINLLTQYQWRSLSIELGINNLFDRHYQQPIGGVSVARFKQQPEQGFQQLDGPGRSFNFGVTWHFD